MAIYTWTGAVSNQFIVPGNWDPNTAGAFGPLSTDAIIFDAAATRDCLDSAGPTITKLTVKSEFTRSITWGGTFTIHSDNFDDSEVRGGDIYPELDSGTLLLRGSASLAVSVAAFAVPLEGAALIRVTESAQLILSGNQGVTLGSHVLVDGGFTGRAICKISCSELTLGREAAITVTSGVVWFLRNDFGTDPISLSVHKSTGQQAITVSGGGKLQLSDYVDLTLEVPILVVGGMVALLQQEVSDLPGQPIQAGFQPHLEARGLPAGYSYSLTLLNGFIRVGPDNLAKIGNATALAGPRTLTAEHGFYVAAEGNAIFYVTTVTSQGAWKVDGTVLLNRCSWTSDGNVDLSGGGTLLMTIRSVGSYGRLTSTGTITLTNSILSFEKVEGFKLPTGTRLRVLAAANIVGTPRIIRFGPQQNEWSYELTDQHMDVIWEGTFVHGGPLTPNTGYMGYQGGRRLAGIPGGEETGGSILEILGG